MTRIFMGTEKALLVADDTDGAWQVREFLGGSEV